MSIDRGKVLVACRRKLEAYRDAYGLEYVGGQELSSLLADIDRALAQPAEAVEGAAPLPMLLFCPRCHSQHVDEPDERTPGWLNPPHRSHLCHACGCIWRPADVATVGVREIATRGKADNWSLSDDAAQGAVATVCLVGERYAHGHMVSVELQLAGEDAPAPNIGDRYYTHPQAAPAQGDVPPEVRNAIDFLTGLRVFVTSRQRIKEPEGDNLFDESVATIRKWLAAAPSQEPRS